MAKFRDFTNGEGWKGGELEWFTGVSWSIAQHVELMIKKRREQKEDLVRGEKGL